MTSRPRLILLGTGSGKASAHRASSSYLLDLKDHGVLLDIGDGATRNFLAAGYTSDWVTDIVITHPHADHVCGFGYFVQQRHLTRTGRPLVIHSAPELHTMLREIIEFGMLYSDRLTFAYSFRPLEENAPTGVGGATVTPFLTTHQAAMRQHALATGRRDPGDTMALLIRVGETTLLYSADLGALSDLDAAPGPYDWLLVETTHVPLLDLWPWLGERMIKRVILTHIGDDFDASQIGIAAKYTTAEIIVAEDGMTFDFT